MQRHHHTPARMAIFKKNTNNKYWQGYGEMGILLHCWECKLVQAMWKSVWKFLKKLKIKLSHGPVIPLLSIRLKKKTH